MVITGELRLTCVMSVCCFKIHSSIVSERAIGCADPREVGDAKMRASRIALFKNFSAGVTPVDVFSTEFIICCTMGSCSYDHLL